MIQRIAKYALSGLIIPMAISCQIQSAQQNAALDEWPEITMEAKPWTRWWWMGNAVDEKNLGQLLEEYDEVGLGGVEIAPIYGAKGYEDRYLDFLSPEWLSILNYTVSKANDLNMGVDLTQGTGWPFGGPQVSIEDAASRIIIQEVKLDTGSPVTVVFEKKRERDPDAELLAVMAFGPDGESKNLTEHLDSRGNLNWPEKGDWEIKAIYLGKTGQMVKRAAPGGVGLTLDHYSKDAVNNYLKYFEKAFQGNPPNFRALYNDSFEVYGADFTPKYFEEFKDRRGYDLKDKIYLLTRNDSTEEVVRVKSDYRETLHELLLENFTIQWTEHAHELGKKTKNQAHGSPGNLLDLYAAVDIPEVETFGSSYFPIPGLRRDSADIRNVDPDPLMLKFASSAAHLSGKNLVSCETFTWLGEHFKSSFAQMKPEVEQAFLAGVNHIFYHGVTYSPEDVPFPGWLFYASLNLTQHNSLWPHFRSFNDYIARCQSILQSGNADNEILMYWPVYDVWANPEGMMEMISVHHVDHWLHPTQFYKQTSSLIDMGYSVDFISDKMISGSRSSNGQIMTSDKATGAKVLIIPETGFMPLETFENILKLAHNGATVIFQEKPKATPGLASYKEDRENVERKWKELNLSHNRPIAHGKGKIILSGDLKKSLESERIHREKLADTGIKFIRRALPNQKYYYLVNHGPDDIDEEIELNYNAESIILMDPLSGTTGKASHSKIGNNTSVRVQLKAGESIILNVVKTGSTGKNPWNYSGKILSDKTIEGPWKLTFDAGGPTLPNTLTMDEIGVWTGLGVDGQDQFSGQATYSNTFELKDLKDAKHMLKFENVHESVKVWVNDHYVGQVWSIPFQINISEYLKQGQNSIKLEVANLMANRIRHMDKQGQEWRNYHEINFVNIDYKSFDASYWNIMPSGIKGPVSIASYSIQ